MSIEETEDKVTFTTGAKRSARTWRFDLIPKIFLTRLAKRFTGELIETSDTGPSPPHTIATGGAHKYGEGNWEKGLPTSDVINHIMDHLTNYQEAFRISLTKWIHQGFTGYELMERVRKDMIAHSEGDDDLAGAAWGIAVLMSQEKTEMFHDDKFKYADPAMSTQNAPSRARMIHKESERIIQDGRSERTNRS